MSAFILQLGCTIQCPHGGLATAITTNTKMRVDGAFALLATDTFTIAGCPLNVSGAPHPCVTIQWVNEAQRVKVDGNPVLLQTSIGLCKAADGLMQGPAVITGVQTRVRGI
jgi:hypothetical protein